MPKQLFNVEGANGIICQVWAYNEEHAKFVLRNEDDRFTKSDIEDFEFSLAEDKPAIYGQWDTDTDFDRAYDCYESVLRGNGWASVDYITQTSGLNSRQQFIALAMFQQEGRLFDDVLLEKEGHHSEEMPPASCKYVEVGFHIWNEDE